MKFADDIGPQVKGLMDVKMTGQDGGFPQGQPGGPVQGGAGGGIPFILSTPHHSMAWAGTPAAQQAEQTSFEAVIPQYEAALAQLEQALQESSLATQQLDAQYRQLLAEYQAVVEAYRAQTGG